MQAKWHNSRDDTVTVQIGMRSRSKKLYRLTLRWDKVHFAHNVL